MCLLSPARRSDRGSIGLVRHALPFQAAPNLDVAGRQAEMSTSGISHVSITVTDLARSGKWYEDVLGWHGLMEDRSETTIFAYGVLPDGTTIVLRVHDEPVGDEFDERRVGLDHLSLTATDATDLETVEARLAELGATYTPTQQMPFGQVLAFRDPDNIALELFYAPPLPTA